MERKITKEKNEPKKNISKETTTQNKAVKYGK